MTMNESTAFHLIERMQRRSPAYLDLITATSEADFYRTFDALLEVSIRTLESNSKNFKALDEEGLSAVLAMSISMPGMNASQETNSNGHVDLTITFDGCFPARTMLGEAKIYKGPEYHISGLQQLLTRYSTGRDGRGLLIVYVRQKNIAGLIAKVRSKLDDEMPCEQLGKTSDHPVKWWFLSRHTHSCGEVLEVGHIGCNLFVDTL